MNEKYTHSRQNFGKSPLPFGLGLSKEAREILNFVEHNKPEIDVFRDSVVTKFLTEKIAVDKQYYLNKLVYEKSNELKSELQGAIKGIEMIEKTISLINKARTNKITEDKANGKTSGGIGI